MNGVQIQCVAVSDAAPELVYCGTFGQGIFVSGDRGSTWRNLPALAGAKVTALFASGDGTLYAGTEPSEVFRSDDTGESWSPLGNLQTLPSAATWSFPPRPETNHVQAILSTMGQPGVLHVAIEAGALLHSQGGGTTWRDRIAGSPLDTHTLATDPRDGGHLFSAAGDGCFESRDGGSTWKPIMDGLAQAYCWAIAVHPSGPDTLLLSAEESAFTAHNHEAAQSFVYRRGGDGRWERAMHGLSSLPQARIPVIVAAPKEPLTFYLAADSVLYRSSDSGTNWSKLEVEWEQGDRPTRHSLSMTISQHP